MPASLGACSTPATRCCSWSPARPSPPATTSTTSSPGASPPSPFCAASRPSPPASPARAGCAPSSTASTRSCSAAASRAGLPPSGPTATPTSPSTARRRGAPTTAAAKALHTLSAYATNARLTLAQQSVPEKTNEITAIPDLLDLLAEAKQLKGALVTIDAMGCQVEIADKIVAHKADYVLTLKGNQPTLEAEVEDYFRTAPAEEIVPTTTVEKGHGRIETRTYAASSCVDWIRSDRSYPGAPRFTSIKTLIQVHRRTEHADRCAFDTHHYISSAPLDIARLAQAVRGHWGVESMHWLLDVAFQEDLSRYRGHGARNMAIVRRFALGLVRANTANGSVKTRRKTASWNPDFLLQLLQFPARAP